MIIIGLFYWYEWRPTQIRKECYKEAKIQAQMQLEEYKKNGEFYLFPPTVESYLDSCLRRHGLEPARHTRR